MIEMSVAPDSPDVVAPGTTRPLDIQLVWLLSSYLLAWPVGGVMSDAACCTLLYAVVIWTTLSSVSLIGIFWESTRKPRNCIVRVGCS